MPTPLIARPIRIAAMIVAIAVTASAAACKSPSDALAGVSGGGMMIGDHPGDLRTYFIEAPAGTRPLGPRSGTKSVITLDQDAARNQDPSGRALALKSFRFQSEALCAWKNADKSDVEMILFRFADAAGARDYASNESGDASNGQQWTVDEVPGGITFTVPAMSGNGTDQTISIAQAGDVVIEMFVDQPSPAGPDLAAKYLTAEYQRLVETAQGASPSA